ncbi:MAG: 3-phosphoshikimate 1-carboxyvinyltransferase, partial [Thermodesulfobacteriota bacterium]
MITKFVKGSCSVFKGEITPPGDKSISHRAVMIGSLAKGKTKVSGFLNGGDTLSTVDAFRKLGIEIKVAGTNIEINGNGLDGLKEPKSIIDAGNSGTTTRLITGLLSAQNFHSEITGDKYLQKRPMARIVKPLTEMGGDITGRDNNNLLPLKIKGKKLKGIKYEVPVASAQVKSCL